MSICDQRVLKWNFWLVILSVPCWKINLSSFQHEMGFNVSPVLISLLLCVLQFVFFLFFCSSVVSYHSSSYCSSHSIWIVCPILTKFPSSFLPLFIYACLYHLLLSQFVVIPMPYVVFPCVLFVIWTLVDIRQASRACNTDFFFLWWKKSVRIVLQLPKSCKWLIPLLFEEIQEIKVLGVFDCSITDRLILG